MKAIIVGAPVEVEGEPTEIAQFVELMTSGVVKIQHQHRWRLGLPNDAGIQHGECFCGEEKDFAPWGGSPSSNPSGVPVGGGDIAQSSVARNARAAASKAAASGTGSRPFHELCGKKHKVGNCKAQVAA